MLSHSIKDTISASLSKKQARSFTVLLSKINIERRYEILGIFMENPSRETFISIVKDIKENRGGWNLTIYKKYQDRNRLDNIDFLQPRKIEKGVYKCNKCGSEECYHYLWQKHSGDEAMTAYVTCMKCGKRWTC